MNLTVRGKHLICDNRKICVSCSNYTWAPNPVQPQKYYYCKVCNTDILCKHGLNISFEYNEYDIMKTIKCVKCGEKMVEKIWKSESKEEENERQ